LILHTETVTKAGKYFCWCCTRS